MDSEILAPDITAAKNLGQRLSYEFVSKGKLQAYHIERLGPQAKSMYY